VQIPFRCKRIIFCRKGLALKEVKMKDGMSIMFLAKIGKTEKFPGLNASGLKIKLQGTLT